MFSVIIPVAAGRDAHDALDSLEGSGVTGDDEVILVGDGHFPDVVADKFSFAVNIYCSSSPAGANAARNLGVEKALSHICAF